MATSTATPPVSTPVPIFKVAHRYMLYDINVVTFLRREHNICGVLTGTLPQASQQNVFLGLPLELMPEEARLLVEDKVAYIVDDVAQHKANFLGNGLDPEERRAFQSALRKQGQAAALEATRRSEDRKTAALKKLATDNWNDIPDDMFAPRDGRSKKKRGAERPNPASSSTPTTTSDDTLFGPPSTTPPTLSRVTSTTSTLNTPEPHALTPTTSHPPVRLTPPTSTTPAIESLPAVPPSYPLYRHLHREGYFLSPGLRFGCQYTAYPGDPLRYHSHFLCSGMGWDEEFDLLDIVGGGRLGTGVKKGFLIGGEVKGKEETGQGENGNGNGNGETKVRTFCIEWGGM